MPATTPISMDIVRGARELEPTAHGLLPHRLPGWARAQCADPQLAMAESQPAGCRLVFRTRSTMIELDALRTRAAYRGMPMRPDGVYDVLIDGRLAGQASLTGGNVLMKDAASGTEELLPGAPGTIRFAGLPDRQKTVEIWLPHNETTELIALRSDQPLESCPITRPIWLHHGSSISHGSNALHPTGTWPALAAAGAGVELINLGMGGAALLDPFTARTMRDIPADLISIKIGINVVNADLMRLRAFGPAVHGFLDTIRDGHPTTPIVVVSALYLPHPRRHSRTAGTRFQQRHNDICRHRRSGRDQSGQAHAARHPSRTGGHRRTTIRGRPTPSLPRRIDAVWARRLFRAPTPRQRASRTAGSPTGRRAFRRRHPTAARVTISD
ncbi:SGNH/GDSL hydrolase family protein [Mycolicibacterium frederiksbergense]|uniref:SGNH/GDSL hydrolase family protein n=1 Tax=Mycolicibacterium frederiksbergense TaxID=117567 RepID=UPI003457852D